MWSYEISQMTNAYQQQNLQQASYANSIGMMNPGIAANNIAGNGMSALGAVAGPGMALGLGLAGMDPISLGMKAGIAAFPTMGLGGAIGMGAAVAAPLALGMYGVQAAGQQVMMGGQQQQQLSLGLRNSMGSLMNGGMGPTNTDAAFMGSQIRAMTHQRGPGGEMAGFGELTSLMQNMGQMGFAQKGTDVRQFAEKFKEMVNTIKTVAKDLGTTLEAAQQAVVSMRGSGIFNTADQLKASSMLRSNSVSGNIAMSETSAMMSIGSQISRSIGGTGRSGAIGGAKTIGQIGTAMQMGAISEEDIYNATGLTGAEGQRAMATSMMQSSARFMRSGKGRFLTASLAGKDGVDKNALDDLLSGGMGVGRTSQLAHKNVARMGIGKYMRDEGRLRGQVLEAVGGNANVLALMSWAGQHGIDVEGMGDREMIFAQRQLGMGREEMDVAMKLATNLPKMREFAKMREGQDQYFQKVRMQQKHTGLEGVKNDFNMMKEKVQGSLQKVGQDIYTDMTDYVERYIRGLTGEMASGLTTELMDSYASARSGGAGGISDMNSLRRNASMGASSFGGGGGLSGKSAMSSVEQYKRHSQNSGILGAVSKALGGKNLEERTGYRFRVGAGENEDVAFATFRREAEALRAGGRSVYAADRYEGQMSARLASQFGVADMERLGKLKGQDYADEMVRTLEGKDLNPMDKYVLNAVKKDKTKMGKLVQSVGFHGNWDASAQFVANSDTPFALHGAGGFRTEGERADAWADTMGKAKSVGMADTFRDFSRNVMREVTGENLRGIKDTNERWRAAGASLRSVADSAAAFVKETSYGMAGWARKSHSGAGEVNTDEGRAAMMYSRSKEGSRILGDLHQGFTGESDMTKIRGRVSALSRKEDDPAAKGELEALRLAIATNEAHKGGDTDDAVDKAMKNAGFKDIHRDEFKRRSDDQRALLKGDASEKRVALSYVSAEQAQKELDTAVSSGIYKAGTGELLNPKNFKSKQLREIAEARGLGLAGLARSGGNEAGFDAGNKQMAASREKLMGMSMADLNSAMSHMYSGNASAEEMSMMGDVSRQRKTTMANNRLVQGAGASVAASRTLGFKLDRNDELMLRNTKDAKSFQAAFSSLTGSTFTQDETQALMRAHAGLQGKGYEITGEDGKTTKLEGQASINKSMEVIKGLGETGSAAKKREERAKEANEKDNPVLVDIRTAINNMKDAFTNGLKVTALPEVKISGFPATQTPKIPPP